MNLANLKKEEIIKRHYWRCVHGHTGLEHPKCYEQAHGVTVSYTHLTLPTN